MSKIWKLFLVFLLVFAFVGVVYAACNPCQQKEQSNPASAEQNKTINPETNIRETSGPEKQSFNTQFLPMVAVSGVAAALNPCVIGLILMLAGYSVIFLKKPILALKIGFTFILTLTILYFFLGIGFYKTIVLLQTIGKFGVFYRVIRYVIATVLVVMGFIGLANMLLPNFGFSFKLPTKLVKPILEKPSISILTTAVVSVIVGLLGLPCSLAVYAGSLSLLPQNLSNLNLVLYLLVFALAFVLPLILFLLLVYFSKKLVALKERQEKLDRYLRGIIGALLIIFGMILLIK